MHKKGYQVKFDDEPMNHWQHGARVASQDHGEMTYSAFHNYAESQKVELHFGNNRVRTP